MPGSHLAFFVGINTAVLLLLPVPDNTVYIWRTGEEPGADTLNAHIWAPQPISPIEGWGIPPFTGEAIQSVRLPFTHRIPLDNSGFFWVFVSVLALWAYMRFVKPRRFTQLMQSFVSNRLIEQIIREEGLLRSDTHVVFSVTGMLVIATFAVQWLRSKTIWANDSFWEPFLLVLALLMIGFLIRLLLFRLTAFVFEAKESMEEYVYLVLLHTGMAGMALFPIQALSVFGVNLPSEALLYVGAVIFTFLYVSRLGRVFAVGYGQQSISVLYIILYLCALEILPVAIVLRFLSNSLLIG